MVSEIRENCSVACLTDKTHPSSRARIAGSEGGDVPEKYYVVQNNEMVRIKYILVYTSKDSPRRLLVFLILSFSCACLCFSLFDAVCGMTEEAFSLQKFRNFPWKTQG